MRSPLALLWLSGVTAAALFIGMQFMLASLSPGILALQFAFTQAAFQGVLAAWQEPGLVAYRAHFPLDFGFLLSYGTFGYLLASRAGITAPPGRGITTHARWLAPAAAACDAGENIAHLLLLSSASGPSALVVAVSATLSLLKWLLLAAFIGTVANAWVAASRRRARVVQPSPGPPLPALEQHVEPPSGR